MTFIDLLKLIKRNIVLVISLPIVFALIAIALSFFSSTGYSATASFVTSGDAVIAKGFVIETIGSYEGDLKPTASLDSSEKKISVTVNGENPDECAVLANKIVEESIKKAEQAATYATSASVYNSAQSSALAAEVVSNNPGQPAIDSAIQTAEELAQGIKTSLITIVTEAKPKAIQPPSLLRSVVVAILAGLFVAICIIVLIDMIKAPLKSRDDMRNITNLPILCSLPSDVDRGNLFANLRFRCDGVPTSIALVPAGNLDSEAAAEELSKGLRQDGLACEVINLDAHAARFHAEIRQGSVTVVNCPTMDKDMGAAYAAHEAEATILCVAEWLTSKRQLASTLEELDLAKANIIGIAYYVPPKSKKRA